MKNLRQVYRFIYIWTKTGSEAWIWKVLETHIVKLTMVSLGLFACWCWDVAMVTNEDTEEAVWTSEPWMPDSQASHSPVTWRVSSGENSCVGRCGVNRGAVSPPSLKRYVRVSGATPCVPYHSDQRARNEMLSQRRVIASCENGESSECNEARKPGIFIWPLRTL